MKKLLIFYNFVIITIMTFVGLLGATDLYQLLSALLFYPLMIYFFILMVPRQKRAPALPTVKQLREDKLVPARQEISHLTKEEEPTLKGKFDVDRRSFIKLIGAAGLSLFLFSIFTKKAEAAFFGSVPGPGTVALKNTAGVKIDPAEKAPTDGYKITEIDDSTPAYYGYVDKTGAWFIMQEDASGHYRYTKGASDFTNVLTGWPNRGGLSYGYFDAIF